MEKFTFSVGLETKKVLLKWLLNGHLSSNKFVRSEKKNIKENAGIAEQTVHVSTT